MVPMKPHHSSVAHLVGTLSIGQLARRWGLGRKEIRRLLGDEKVPFVQIDGQIRVALSEVKLHEETEGLSIKYR